MYPRVPYLQFHIPVVLSHVHVSPSLLLWITMEKKADSKNLDRGVSTLFGTRAILYILFVLLKFFKIGFFTIIIIITLFLITYYTFFNI